MPCKVQLHSAKHCPYGTIVYASTVNEFMLYYNTDSISNQLRCYSWKTPSTLLLWRLHTLVNVLLVMYMYIHTEYLYIHDRFTCLVIVEQSHMTEGSHGYESSQSSPPATTNQTSPSIPQHTTNHAIVGPASCEGAGQRER